MIIAIVGGGASGTLAANHLLGTARAPLTVLLLERPGPSEIDSSRTPA